MEPSTRLSTSQSPQTTAEIALMHDKLYHKAVGELTYVSLGTRPYITFAFQVVSQYLINPGIAHWDAVERIFRYLLGTKELWLVYGSGKLNALGLIGYTNANGNMAEDCRAISAFAFMLYGGAITWSAKN